MKCIAVLIISVILITITCSTSSNISEDLKLSSTLTTSPKKDTRVIQKSNRKGNSAKGNSKQKSKKNNNKNKPKAKAKAKSKSKSKSKDTSDACKRATQKYYEAIKTKINTCGNTKKKCDEPPAGCKSWDCKLVNGKNKCTCNICNNKWKRICTGPITDRSCKCTKDICKAGPPCKKCYVLYRANLVKQGKCKKMCDDNYKKNCLSLKGCKKQTCYSESADNIPYIKN